VAREEQTSLDPKHRVELLKELEGRGRSEWEEIWKEHIGFPQGIDPSSTVRREQENVLRFMVLRALINQQAQADKAIEISRQLFLEFGERLLSQPFQISGRRLFAIFHQVGGERGRDLYRVGALGGIKPISLFSYRVKAFEEFMRWLDESNQSLSEFIFSCLNRGGASALLKGLTEHEVLGSGWVGNDPKACRMLVDWIVFLIVEVWKEEAFIALSDTVMLVNGHVGKVFCRTGLLGTVIYNKNRPYIIEAAQMRPAIEEIVSTSGLVPFYVDNGAYYLFKDGFCLELNPKCFECPVSALCLKHIKWTAYQKQRE
jgi:hypothetical protein